MTREEAIKILKALNLMMHRPDGTPVFDGCEAIDMAIEALSAEAKGDLISRQWLLDLYETPKDGDGVNWKVPLEVVQQNIKDAPSADAVEVVRCKDCKNRARYAVCDFLGEDGFCSHGERREDGEE